MSTKAKQDLQGIVCILGILITLIFANIAAAHI